MSSSQSEAKRFAANPFTPIFGKIPAYLAGREKIIEDVLRALGSGEADPNLSSIFVGARGTGKTTLLSYLASEAAAMGWISVSVTASSGMLDDILQRTAELGAHLIDSSSSRKVSGVGVASLGSISWESDPDTPLNWRSKMNRMLDQLAATGTGLLMTVDEVNPNLEEMVHLAITYQHFVREDRKVALLMAGLPHNVSGLVSGESTSFLRRAFRHDLGSIPPEDIENAFRITLERNGKGIEDDALAKAVRAADGFPYMFQLVGYRMWNASEGRDVITAADVDAGVRLARGELRRQVLDATYNDLSDGDVAFLRAMLEDEKSSSAADLAARLDKPSGHVSTYKRRLLESGVIEEAARGRLRFSLPGFREYLLDTTD